MATARELLEQADALMRRNRLRSAEMRPGPVDIPVLTEAVEEPPIQALVAEPANESSQWRAQVDDGSAAGPESVAPESAAPESGVPESGVPESGLSEPGLPESVAPESVAPPRAELPLPVLALDDVPVLTDVVEEIEAPIVVDARGDEGEPSQWLDDLERGEVSVTGPLPDSAVAVPASFAPDALAYAASPNEDFDARATDIAIDAHEDDSAPVKGRLDADRAAGVDVDAEVGVHAVAAGEQEDGETEAPHAFALDELALDELEAPSAPPREPFVEPPSEPSAESTFEPPSEPPSASALLASARSLVAHHEPPPADAVPADDDERWDTLAEEIRMQVLQRIDIFTDTGMREQLTARLQPIVDRASADLVATINQHVGQLLRTYVAEAIEREIEKWRQGGG